jgi:formyltetrahydrofolate synthetase
MNNEINSVRRMCEHAGARVALSKHWQYGGDGVTYTPEAQAKLKRLEADPEMKEMTTCMVKTHLSLSHDPKLKGVADSRHSDLQRRRLCGASGRGHHPDARHGFRSGLPPH